MGEVEKEAKEYVEKLCIQSSSLEEKTSELVTGMMSHPCYTNPDYAWSLEDFEVGTRLGRGKFGRVYLAREKQTRYLVALKTVFKKEVVQGRVQQQVLREIEIQTHLKHPNILQLLCWFHDSHRVYLVMEFAGKGEIYKHLRNSPGGRFNSHLAAKYTYQVAAAVEYCHQHHVIHRDIKPENIMLTIHDDVKLGDFGWSVHAPSLTRKTLCGTLDYLPPEMVDNNVYSKHVDNWCIGVLLYEFLVGTPPFESSDQETTYKKIKSIDMVYPNYIPKGAREIISQMLLYKGRDRLSLKEFMQHPWILENK